MFVSLAVCAHFSAVVDDTRQAGPTGKESGLNGSDIFFKKSILELYMLPLSWKPVTATGIGHKDPHSITKMMGKGVRK